MSGVLVQAVTAGPQIESVRQLLREYARTIPAAVACFQDLESEMAGLPGAYAPPAGCLLLAELGGRPAGCVALRRIDAARCEMKRLYVRPVFRGVGLAGMLIERAIEEARAIGYEEMLLDTLPGMRAARALYEMLGFRPCAPYLPEPTGGAECLALDLRRPSLG